MWGVAAATGWAESFILWELPLARLYQYEHCLWLGRGVVCHWASGSEETAEEYSVLAARTPASTADLFDTEE